MNFIFSSLFFGGIFEKRREFFEIHSSKSMLRCIECVGRKVENFNRRFIGKTRGILCYIKVSCSSLLIELGNSLKNNSALTHQLCPGETTKAGGGPLEIDTTSYK